MVLPLGSNLAMHVRDTTINLWHAVSDRESDGWVTIADTEFEFGRHALLLSDLNG